MNFLKSGGKNFPLEILKECGIDLNTDKPYKVAFNYIDKHLKEIELIVNEKSKIFSAVGDWVKRKKYVGIMNRLLDKQRNMKYNEIIIGEYGFFDDRS